MRRFVIPLASYVAVTVVVPLLNGVTLDAAFLRHGAVAIGFPIAIVVAWALFRTRSER